MPARCFSSQTAIASSPPDFDEVFRSEGVHVIKAPVRAPKAWALAERWVGSVRRECLDRILVLGRRHLHHVLVAYIRHYSQHRPQRALDQRPPLRTLPPTGEQPIGEVIDLDRVRRPRPARRTDPRIVPRGAQAWSRLTSLSSRVRVPRKSETRSEPFGWYPAAA